MTAISDREWERLAARWQAPEAAPTVEWVHRLVDRQTRGLRLMAACEALIVVGALAFAVAVVVSERTSAAVGLGLAAIVHTGLVAGFTGWNRLGIWRPLGESTLEYLRLARERCLRQRRSARFMAGLMITESAGLAAWMVGSDFELPRSGWRVGLALLFGGLIAWSIRLDRVVAGRLAQLAEIEEGIAYH